jgi:hypothetical protein
MKNPRLFVNSKSVIYLLIYSRKTVAPHDRETSHLHAEVGSHQHVRTHPQQRGIRSESHL